MTAFAAWLENPVVTRETRARWRGRAFVVLFGYAFLLGLAMLWAYGMANYDTVRNPSDGLGNMARVGHSLFQTLACTQIGCWMLLAPALTATSIAWERETGVLEGIQLSPLPGYKIVVGKLISVFFFMGLLLLAALPISSVCFLMGGVSPGEFQTVLLLQVVTAITGAFIGLACSALCRRANIALALTFALMIGWFFGSMFCMALSSAPMTGFNNFFSVLFGRSNPFLAALELTSPPNLRNSLRASSSWFPGFFDLDYWQTCVLIQLALWAPCSWLAARGAGRPFPEATWLGEGNKKPRRRRKKDAEEQSWEAVVAGQNTALGEILPSSKGAGERPSRRWDTPLVQFIRSNNPVFQREARSKFRLRRLPFIPAALGGCLLLFMGYWYVRGIIYTFEDPHSRVGLWFFVNFVWLILAVLCSSIMGGSTFSREREAGTWEGLGLSLLSAREIVGAKLRAPLLAISCYSLLLFPFLAFCTLRDGPSFYGNYSPYLTVQQFCGSLMLQAATVYFVLVLGLYLSWRSKRTAMAIGWMIGVLIVGWAFVPGFIMSSVNYRDQDAWGAIFSIVNPFFAMGYLTDNYNPERATDSFVHALCCVGLLSVYGTVLLFLLCRDIERRRFGLFAR